MMLAGATEFWNISYVRELMMLNLLSASLLLSLAIALVLAPAPFGELGTARCALCCAVALMGPLLQVAGRRSGHAVRAGPRSYRNYSFSW